MPGISIIVPIYNVERYLSRCVDSILLQSFTDFELILVDDGSPDRCGIICDEYAAKDTRIRVIHQENGKVSVARNAGLDAAQGEWIAFVDPDDWIHKDYLKILLSGAMADTDLVICGCLSTSNDEETDQDYSSSVFESAASEEVYSDYIGRTRIWGRIIRRSTIGGLRYIPGTDPLEDACFNELLFRGNMKFRVTDTKLYYYYSRPDSAVHAPMSEGLLNTAQALFAHIGRIQASKDRARVIKRCYKYTLSVRYLEMLSKDYGRIEKECRELIRQLAVYLPELAVRDRLIMWVMSTSPAIYRVWRLLGDPTLLEYERKCIKAGIERRKQKRSKSMNKNKERFNERLRNDKSVRTLTDDELARVQRIYLQMVTDIVETCQKEGIFMTLSGGSVLGAIRHKGFIPWDDDMDINMPRKDFERLKECFDTLFEGKYVFRAPNHRPHSGYRCGKFECPKVKILDASGFRHGLTIDVFILENVPDSPLMRYLRGIRSEFWRIIAGLVFEYESYRVVRSNDSRVSLKRKTCLLAGKILSFRKSEKYFDKVDRVNQYKNEKTKLVGLPSGRYHYFGEIYPREAMMEAMWVPFENTTLPIPKGYDIYLKTLYRDYMTIPPEEKREHHYIRAIHFED